MTTDRKLLLASVVALLAVSAASAEEAKSAVMFGFTPNRNMVSAEKGLPVKFDLKSGLNIKWVAELGSQTYAGPILAGDKVFVGTNRGVCAEMHLVTNNVFSRTV